jgi:hypothetical protein
MGSDGVKTKSGEEYLGRTEKSELLRTDLCIFDLATCYCAMKEPQERNASAVEKPTLMCNFIGSTEESVRLGVVFTLSGGTSKGNECLELTGPVRALLEQSERLL